MSKGSVQGLRMGTNLEYMLDPIFLFVYMCASMFGLQMRYDVEFSTCVVISELKKKDLDFGFKDYLKWQILTFANLIAISVFHLLDYKILKLECP